MHDLGTCGPRSPSDGVRRVGNDSTARTTDKLIDSADERADDADPTALGLAAERCRLRGMVAHHGSERLGSAFVRAHLAGTRRWSATWRRR